ncbi:MAG: tetratricopeptide repeat protein [Deltaproteobacteria bacterium]|nr:tetratricopeptide repeat protein [Deltaproteobacteria bacterium]
MKTHALIPAIVLLISLAAPLAARGSITAVRALDVERMASPASLKAAQELMQATFAAAGSAPGFELQKLLIEKAGHCISSIIDAQHKQSLPVAEAQKLLVQNRELLGAILRHNQQIVADMQEQRLDSMQNTEAFFQSAAWQQPQHLISLAGYWQSWNGYYRALLMDSAASGRAELLEQARQGFSRAFIDFQEQSIVTRSLFGRMLCYKEAGRYDSAMQDADALLAMTSPSDALYVRCRYEQLVIAYQRGSCADVLKGVESFRNDIGPAGIPAAIAGGLKTLSVQCGIATIEEAEKKGGAEAARYRSVLQDLRALTAHEPARAPILYRFVSERPDVFAAMPVAEMGAVGNLALADHLFKKQHWQEAAERYAYVLATDEAVTKSRKDEILFYLACCECKLERWERASGLFSRLFKEYPASKHLAQAACYYYVAAAQGYHSNKTSEHHQRYIAASRRYLEKCADQQNACEARYQLGSHYLEQQREPEALKEFERIKPGSPRYLEARFHIVRSRVDAFERQHAGTAARSNAAHNSYRHVMQQIQDYAAAVERSKLSGKDQLRAYVGLMQARLLMHGPAPDHAGALKLLRSVSAAPDRQSALKAAGLRIECLQQLGASDEARQEIDAFIKKQTLASDSWMMLQETAARLYAASKELRRQQDSRVSDFAATALHIYSALAREAGRSSARAEFLEALNLRIAEIHRDENRLDAARALYEEQLARDETSADALYNLALIYEQQADWSQAASCWRKLTRGLQAGTPRWFEARRQTVIALKHLGDLKQACDYANMTLILHPDIADPETEQTFIRLRQELCGPGAAE